MKKQPFVSVVIVNFNGKKFVKRCIEAVLKNKYPNFEVIIVDNGSQDNSPEFLKKIEATNKNFTAILLKKNYGPAYARNRGVEKARGKYLAFLDNDTMPEKNWLIPLVEAMEKDQTIGACQCKLLLMKERNKFDYAGDYLSQFGFLVQRVEGGEVDQGQADQRAEILSAKSAAMIISKGAFQKAGGFDEDYFIYLEETDLGWRTWLVGYRIIFVPESRVYHEFGTTTLIDPNLQNYNVKFHGTKNYITTLIKNLGSINLIKILPIHIFLWVGIAGWTALKRNFYESSLIFRGIIWNFFHFFSIIKKRSQIQAKRKISDKDLFPKIMRRKSFAYFYNKFVKPHKIGRAKSWQSQK